MNKAVFLSILCVSFIFHFSSVAQFKQKAENELLKELNKVLKKSPNHHWEHDGKMSIDSAFAINTQGNLTLTVRYTTDTSVLVVRTEAPLNKIVWAEKDVYLILKCNDKAVSIFNSEKNNNKLSLKIRRNMFHIGVAEDDSDTVGKVQKLLDNLRKFYPLPL